jgi:hypothetical protein
MHDYDNEDDWYKELVEFAQMHCAGHLVKDRQAWVEGWQLNSPQDAFYDEYPEYIDQ